MKPKIEHSGGYCYFSFPDHLNWEQWHVMDCIQEIKDSIPVKNRSYDPATKTWCIKEDFIHVVNDIFDRYFTDPNQIEMF